MIPRAYITEWRAHAPWPLDEQVEQDLVLTRALAELYARPVLGEALAFRGGTALHKLHLQPPTRYSEDLDLVQIEAGPIGELLADVRDALDPWLGEPSYKQSPDSVKLVYHFETTVLPVRRMRVKIEINTREHFSVRGFVHVPFDLRSAWHDADVEITSYGLEELLATKLRALYQRRKGRDLYDLWLALTMRDVDETAVADCFGSYLEHAGLRVSRAEFEANLAEKLHSADFRGDVLPLLRDGAGYDVDSAAALVGERLVARLPGEPWKGLG